MCVAVAADGYQLSVVSSAYTRYQAGNKARGRYLGQNTPREGTTRRRFWWSVTDTRNRERHSLRKTTTCTNLFADRNRRLEIMLPNALHRQLRTESAAESPGDQSGPNKQSGLTQCDLQQKADSDSSSSPRRRCVCSPQHSTTAESAVAAKYPQIPSRLVMRTLTSRVQINRSFSNYLFYLTQMDARKV